MPKNCLAFYVLTFLVMIFSGCSTASRIEQRYKSLDFIDQVSAEDAVVIAQHSILFSMGKLYTQVDIRKPRLMIIDWNDPDNAYKKENVRGYYQKFQECWAVNFPPVLFKSARDKVGCQVWVHKQKSEARIICSRVEL